MKNGDIVYYVLPYGRRKIEWGILSGEYIDGYELQLYELRDTRRINGTPIADFQFNAPRMKLPKDWTWDTSLCEITWDEIGGDVHLDKPDELLKAIADGVLVQPNTQQKAGVIESDITKDGWTIMLRFPFGVRISPSTATVRRDYCFATYEEVKRVMDNYDAELARQAALSDYDWSVEQIDHTLDRFVGIGGCTKEQADDARKFLLKQRDVENIVTRIYGGNLQWKYDRNKAWKTWLA